MEEHGNLFVHCKSSKRCCDRLLGPVSDFGLISAKICYFSDLIEKKADCFDVIVFNDCHFSRLLSYFIQIGCKVYPILSFVEFSDLLR